jgi:hypothetical protein
MVWAPPLRYLTFSNHANIIQPSFIRLPSIPSAGQAARVLRCKQAIGPAGFFNAIWRHFHVSMWYDMAIHGIVWMKHLNRASIRYHQISIDFCETKKFEKGKKREPCKLWQTQCKLTPGRTFVGGIGVLFLSEKSRACEKLLIFLPVPSWGHQLPRRAAGMCRMLVQCGGSTGKMTRHDETWWSTHKIS